MKIPKQKFYLLNVHHQEKISQAFMWWITRQNPHCKHFCPTCPYFFRCQEDIARLKLDGDYNNSNIIPILLGVVLGIGLVAVAIVMSILILNKFS